MSDKKRNVTVTQLSEKQYEWLEKNAKEKALSLTAVIKILIEDAMTTGDKYTGDEGIWS
jgi:hypothetical protein